MIKRVKAGTAFALPVKIRDSNFSDISAIEFLFKQEKKGRTLKTAYWSRDGESRDAVKRENENTILVIFSREDTYLFAQDELFFLDTRIHYDGSDMNPFSDIVQLTMSETLFGRAEEVTADG